MSDQNIATNDMGGAIEEAVSLFMEDEVQMTDHEDDYKNSFRAGVAWALAKFAEKRCDACDYVVAPWEPGLCEPCLEKYK